MQNKLGQDKRLLPNGHLPAWDNHVMLTSQTLNPWSHQTTQLYHHLWISWCGFDEERRASSLTSCKVRENRPALGTALSKQCCNHTTESCNRGQRSEQMMRDNIPFIWVRNKFLWKNTVEDFDMIKSKITKKCPNKLLSFFLATSE